MSGDRDELAAVLHHEGWEQDPGWQPDPTCGTCRTSLYLADLILGSPAIARLLAEAWNEGRCAAARGIRSNPYVDDKPSKDGED